MRNPYSRNKDLWGCLLLLILLISLCGCSPSAKSEREIISDLQQSPAFISETVKIDSCEIIKRQTNNDSKSDLVYLTVYVNEDELTCALSYLMEYVLYNDGWILENVSQYDDGPWIIDGLPIERISSDITSRDSYFSDYTLEVTKCEIVGEGDSYDGKGYEKRFDILLNASCSIFDYEATYEAVYQITGDGWNFQYMTPTYSRYAPTFSPNINVADLESLELGSGAYATNYDDIEYLKTETDWENRTETQYYTATKEWWFGVETYLVAVPLNFSLENGEDSALWTYRESTIESSLQSVDWNITGTWCADDPSYDVDLSIFSILGMRNSDTFPVMLRCKAEYYYDSKVLYCCNVRDVKAEIRQIEPGFYQLYIANPSEEFNGLWKGIFVIAGYDTNIYSQGVAWTWGDINTHRIKLSMDYDEKAQIEQATKNVISAAKEKGLDVISYDEDNPIYGVWKVIHPTGLPEIFCFCPDGTVVYTHLILLSSPVDSTYTYSDTTLALWEIKWSLNWETPDFFNMTALDDPDNFWPSFSRIPL